MDEVKIIVSHEGNIGAGNGFRPVDFDLTSGHTPKIIGADHVYADFVKLPPRQDYSVRLTIPGYEHLVFWQGEKLTVADSGIVVFDFYMPDDLYNTAPHVNLLQVKYQSRPQTPTMPNFNSKVDWSKPILPVKPLVTVHSYRFVPRVQYQMGDISKILRIV